MAKLRITLHSDLCASSGSGFGNMIDTDVVLDDLGVPYIPGRRIKGCLRQSAEDLRDYGCDLATGEAIEKLFGNGNGLNGALTVDSAFLPDIGEVHSAILNARHSSALKDVASSARIPDLFTYVRGSTAMENGMAKDGTLRFIRVVSHYSALHPDREVSFEGCISLSDPALEELLKLSCQATRHIGSSRNRGLGEVTVEYFAEDTEKIQKLKIQADGNADRYVLEYQLYLDAPMMMPGVENRMTAVSSRAVIGCLSASWLKTHKADDHIFRRLFLNGEVQWKELTPVAHGKRSIPAPRFLARLKDADTKLVNMLAEQSAAETNQKKKTMEGCFACMDQDGFELLSVPVSSAYHHSTEKPNQKETLYVEEILDSGVVYGGTVIVPADLVEEVSGLIQEADFRFGRSRSAQYGSCRLIAAPKAAWQTEEYFEPKSGETVYALLLSDLVLYLDGLNICSPDAVRKVISEAVSLLDEKKTDGMRVSASDSCSYRQIGGYHQMWQMRKPVSTAVCAGSYYRFVSDGRRIPREIRLGEYPQEGMGRVMLISEAEMKQKIRLTMGSPDKLIESEQISQAMAAALLVKAAEEFQKQAALKYVASHPKLREEIQIGRLRLMLAECDDLTDLVKRVGSIKTEKYRKRSLGVLRSLYSHEIPADLDPEKIQVNPMKPDPRVMLAGADDLLELIRNDSDAEKRIIAMWKNILSSVLHLAYYQERREDAIKC